MTPIQQQIAALAEWHRTGWHHAGLTDAAAKHAETAALLDKLAKAETRRSAIYIGPDASLTYATALLIPEET